MGSLIRIVALLGVLAPVHAQYDYGYNSSTTTTCTTSSTRPHTSLDCQPDNCLRQFQQSSQVTPFCATYTTALITQTAPYPSYVSQCSGKPARISSACSCIVTGTPSIPSSSTCQPSTVTVTFTPPIQTYTITQKYV